MLFYVGHDVIIDSSVESLSTSLKGRWRHSVEIEEGKTLQTLRAVYDGISGVALNVETYSKRHEIPSRDQPISVVTFVFISIVIFLTGFVSEKLNGMGVVKIFNHLDILYCEKVWNAAGILRQTFYTIITEQVRHASVWRIHREWRRAHARAPAKRDKSLSRK